MVGWLVGWWGLLVGCLVSRLFGWSVGWLVSWAAASPASPASLGLGLPIGFDLVAIQMLLRAGFGRVSGLLRSYIMRAGLGYVWGSFRLCKGLISRMLISRMLSFPLKPPRKGCPQKRHGMYDSNCFLSAERRVRFIRFQATCKL